MNVLHDWVDPLAIPLAEWTLQVSLLMAVVLALRVALGRWLAPRWRCAIWAIVLLRMFLPTLPQNLLPQRATITLTQTTASEVAAPLIRIMTIHQTGVPPIAPLSGPRSIPTLVSATSVGSLLPAMLVALWIVGVLVCLLRAIVMQIRLRRLLGCLPTMTDPRVCVPLEALADALRVRRFRVVSCDPPISPAVAGLFEPTLIVPRDLADQLSPRQLRLVLTHELLHVRRRDKLWRWLATLTVAAQWFNPLVRLARRCCLIDCELATDAAVMRNESSDDRHAYGQALLLIASQSRTKTPAGAIGVFGSSGVSARINAMITTGKSSRLAALIAVLVAGCSALPRTAVRSDEQPSLVTRTYDVRDLQDDAPTDHDPAAAQPLPATPSTSPQAIAYGPSISELISHVRAQTTEGNYTIAISLLKEILRRDPDNAYALAASPLVEDRLKLQGQAKYPRSNRPLDTSWSDGVTRPLSSTTPSATTTPTASPIGDGGTVEHPKQSPLGLNVRQMTRNDSNATNPPWLVGQIQTRVDPPSWQVHGGRGSLAAHDGQLTVMQTPENQTRVEELLNALRDGRKVQVVIETHFLRGGHIAWLANEMLIPRNDPPAHTAIITEVQANALISEVQTDKDSTHLTAPRLTTFSGQRAFVAVTTDTAYVSDIEAILGADAKGKTIAAYQPTVSVIDSGVILDCLATASADKKTVALQLHPQQSNLLKMNAVKFWETESGKRTKAKIKGPLPSGDATVQVPIVERASIDTTVTVPDRGCFLAIIQPTISPADADVPGAERLVLLVKPTIVDGSTEHPFRSATTRLSDESLPR